MSAGPPTGPDEGGPNSPEPSDLLAVEGLTLGSEDESRAATPPSREATGSRGSTGPRGSSSRGGASPRATTSPRAAAPVVELPRAIGSKAAREVDDDRHAEGEHAERYDAESLPRGTQLGRYVLLGGVSGRSSEVVYGAYDPEGDRKVSIKLFHPGLEEGEQAQATRLRLVRQAQALAKLSHPCVERIYEAGIYGPWVFLATEFIDGLDLRQWMEARDEPFPWPEVLRVYREAGRGLAAAHKLGIVHRDFKPSNVILGKEGRLVVVDFGLAQEVEEDDDDIDISELRESWVGAAPAEDTQPTAPGMSGTPAYMAPEQHLTGHSDARSDQFSFCVALYEALYGERPFSGNRPRAIALEATKHNVRPPPAGASVPAWLRAVLVRGLAPHPQERFGSMEALLRELARDPAASRRRWGWGGALAVGLAAVGGLVAVQLEADRSVCEGQGHALTEVWTPEQRDALHGAFAATGRAWAEPTWRYTELRLDTWADEWRDLSERACLSTRVWADSGQRTYELRQACLDRHLEGLRATLEVLDAIDGPTLDHAHVLAQGLPPPRQCIDTDTLLTLGLPVEDQRDAVDALHRELAGLHARLALGHGAAVLREAQALQARAEATDDAPLVARSRLLLGRARLAVGEPQAEAALHHAARSALEAGHPELAAEAWLARMEALRRAGRAAEAVALGDYVEGILVHKRFGWLRPSLDLARGDAERSRERAAEALAHYHAALEHEQARPDPDPLRMLAGWQGQAEIHVARGRLDEAVAPLETALEVTRDALGPLHPAAIDVLVRLGQVQQRRKQPDKARAHLEQALELVREAGLHDPVQAAALEGSLGSLYAEQGDHERARAHLERAYEARGGAAAAEHAETFELGLQLAREHRDAGDATRAREVLGALLVPVRDVPPAMGNAHAAADRPSTTQRFAAELLLATLMWDAGEPEAARAAITSAALHVGDAAAHQAFRDDAARWLEEHPAP